jgi:hypothetical protein
MSMAYEIGIGRKRQCPNLRCDHHICLEALKKTTENISHDRWVLGMNPTANHSSTFFVGSRVVLKFSRVIRYYKQLYFLCHSDACAKAYFEPMLDRWIRTSMPWCTWRQKICGTSAKQSKQVMPSTILQRTSNGEERNLDLQKTFLITYRLATS